MCGGGAGTKSGAPDALDAPYLNGAGESPPERAPPQKDADGPATAVPPEVVEEGVKQGEEAGQEVEAEA